VSFALIHSFYGSIADILRGTEIRFTKAEIDNVYTLFNHSGSNVGNPDRCGFFYTLEPFGCHKDGPDLSHFASL
jgi:hypothetical protein